MRKLLFLLLPTLLSAQCVKPVITGTTGASDATGQQLTLTWTTSVPADSTVQYGTPNPGTITTTTDTAGVTSHSATITDLMPKSTYGWGVRSQAINGGVGCGTGYIAFDGMGSGSHATTMGNPPTGSFTYGMSLVGPTYVTQGNGIYVAVNLYTLTGSYGTTGLQIAVTGLPSSTTVNWSGANNNGGVFPIENDTQSNVHGVNFDTVQVNQWNWYPQEFRVLTSSTTPPGNYTLTLTASAINSSGYPTVVQTWPLHVVSSSAPFSGVVLAQGVPSSYPEIPNVATFLASADTYGQQSCAQDTDNPRTIRVNTANIIIPSACCTYDSWFYDGWQVYYNVERMLHNGRNWAQCRANVAQVYREGILGGTVTNVGASYKYMEFSKGYYTDYLQTGITADLSLINKFNSSNNAPYHGYYVDVSYLQREVPYVMRNLIHGVALGQTTGSYGNLNAAGMRDYSMEHVLGMVDQICLSQNAQYFENFMTGLQAMDLLEYYNIANADPRIPPALACLASYLYANQWQALNTGSFPYDKYQAQFGVSYANGSTDCQNSLNNLISPMYAWLFRYTGDSTWQTKGDAIFSHGALFDCSPLPTGPNAYLTMRFDSDGKTYSQQYEWGDKYISWRSPVTTQ